MSHSTPPNSSSPSGSSRSDEWVAVLIALLAIGGFLFWTFGRDTKPEPRKFASPGAVAVPEVSATDRMRISQVLEESFSGYEGQETPQEVVPPRRFSRNVFRPIPPSEKTATNFDSAGVNPVSGFAPFFFAPRDSEVTIAPIPTLDPAATSGNNETAIAPVPAQQPAATEPEVATSPEPQQQAEQTNPGTVVVPIVPPQQPTATEPQAATPQPQQQAQQPQTAPTPVPLQLTDVPEDYWARPFIQYAAKENIVVPYANGRFKPNQPITRAELAADLENAFVPKENKPGNPSYKDVTSNYWAEQAIVDVTRTGFMTGYPGEVFNPNLAVPRVQVLVALASGLQLQPPENPQEIVQQAYQDADQIPQWAVEKVAAATQAGLVVNYPETNILNPAEPATRAEVAAMIYQGLVQSGQAEPISSDYIVKSEK